MHVQACGAGLQCSAGTGLRLEMSISTSQGCSSQGRGPATAMSSAVVVNFYAPWCHWCQRLEPTWEAATKEVHEKYPEWDGRIRFAKVCAAGMFHTEVHTDVLLPQGQLPCGGFKRGNPRLSAACTVVVLDMAPGPHMFAKGAEDPGCAGASQCSVGPSH
jgi:thiol-disulfide isomerase/thioredoxin